MRGCDLIADTVAKTSPTAAQLERSSILADDNKHMGKKPLGDHSDDGRLLLFLTNSEALMGSR